MSPTHPIGRGVAGGYAAIGDLIAAVHPIAVIQGHDHEWFGAVRETSVDEFPCLAIHPGPRGMLLHVQTATGRVWVEVQNQQGREGLGDH